MKIKSLIKELKKQGRISLIQESPEVSKSYKEKSDNSLRASKILYKQNLVEESISMSYYSMYNRLLSLLYLTGIKSENHFFSIFLLKEIFNFDNKDLIFAKKERINKKYYTSSKLSLEDAKDMINLAETFNEKIDLFIDKISLENIKIYRSKFQELIK